MTLTDLGGGQPARPAGGPPTVVRAPNGGYQVTWPKGRPAEFPIGADLFEQMIAGLNSGRIAEAALRAIGEALTTVVPSA